MRAWWRRPAPTGRHAARRGGVLVRFRRVDDWSLTRVTIDELAGQGLARWPAAAAAFISPDLAIWCRDCLDDPAARSILTALYPLHHQAVVIFGAGAGEVAGRRCVNHAREAS